MNENETENELLDGEQNRPSFLRRNFATIVILAVCLAAYLYFENIYLSMIAYGILSFCLVAYNDLYGSDLIKVALIFIMPFAFNDFSTAYRIALCGFLMQSMGIDTDKMHQYSPFRREFGSLFMIVGTILTLAGITWGIYNVFFK